MGDRNAPGAVQVVTTPDYEAMVIGAHPDDADFGTAATSALWAKQGKKVVWVVMTDGTEGGEVPSIPDTEFMLMREQEQRMAAEVLGVKQVEFLRFPDGHLTNSEAARKAIVKLIRKYRPRVVFTHDPSQHILAPDPNTEPNATAYLNHPDHRATGNIVLDAIFPAVGNPRAYRELLTEGLEPYRVHELYLFFSAQINTYVDVTETIDLKGKALECHVTQFGPDADMHTSIKTRAAEIAREAKEKMGLDMQYAEAFRRIKLHVPPAEPQEEAPTEMA
ncbi:LmbE family N-acetylglucosaminyl deacetylase [Thermosporothrix hazakensis]|jgi:LmbE family N-acetylglucosaminyl deacetylase|uniref:LmbE family N-acetylglucosaminyl deacetylase n=2 Tax=Thermosporothrix TaxID=768650 RepID=A0A326UCR3_THEHA|nr:PIG-L deacetylase family protein [Thermosporothrix hazakensis]PZW36106.1 LmbE family N-acetylglucosaminyl deacetylase [Thermosporothrix hazakensis]BBH88572.1 GlcNAc-PI de-N-acetylase [Thermosporothrix sp. COM3]GCE46757.1 GlcNAc-PI de-N-acetylase [Thermosporothrix hazakensis]